MWKKKISRDEWRHRLASNIDLVARDTGYTVVDAPLARTQSTHAGFVYKSCLFRVCYRSSLTRNPSETAMRFFTSHVRTSRVFPSSSLPSPVLAAPAVPLYPPSFLTYLSTSPFAVSIISIHRCCLANRVDREAVFVNSQPLVNHATVNDGNESPAIIVRIIETRWKSSHTVRRRLLTNSFHVTNPTLSFSTRDLHIWGNIYAVQLVSLFKCSWRTEAMKCTLV